MEKQTKNMTSGQAETFALHRMAHRNLESICSAMESSGILDVSIYAYGENQKGSLDPDMDWKYGAAFDNVAADKVLIDIVQVERENGIPYLSDPIQMNFRDALMTVSGDILFAVEPGWDAADKAEISVTVCAGDGLENMGVAELRGKTVFGDETRLISGRMSAYDPLSAFKNSEPVLSTEKGDWYEIENQAQADAATDLGRTAVSHFYKSCNNSLTRATAAEGTKWHILISHEDQGSRAVVTMASQLEDGFDVDIFPGKSHLTGFMNSAVHVHFKDEIEALAAKEGLHVEMNYMGHEIKDDVDESIEP